MDSSTTGAGATAASTRLRLSPAWLVFAAIALAVPLAPLLLRTASGPALPDLGELPPFSLVDEGGRPFGRGDLQGRVWIADFVFTSCADACPRLTAKMKRLQDELGATAGVSLLSISVDPERDTPARLRDYARDAGAGPGWKWLTGPEADLERTVVQGFHIAMSRLPGAAPAAVPPDPDAIHAAAFDILHGEKLVLVDARARLRGYYDADDAERLLVDARGLAKAGGR